MKTIYLCGGINKLSDADAMDWREAAKKELTGSYDFLDPMRRDYRGREAESVREIITGDMEDIRQSDIILVNAVRPSWGTGMELYMAHGWGKKVITVCPDDRPSPWLVGHSHKLVKTFAEAFAVLKSMPPKGAES
jgi:nucleoside 2-deoxyribosyltransferase